MVVVFRHCSCTFPLRGPKMNSTCLIKIPFDARVEEVSELGGADGDGSPVWWSRRSSSEKLEAQRPSPMRYVAWAFTQRDSARAQAEG
jgi:hypothetical protein